MQLALRPLTTAGVALVGAGVIAVSPLAPPPVTTSAATTTVSTAAVQLTTSSFVDPVTRWMQVFEATSANLSEIGAYMDARPDRSLPGLLTFLQAKGDGYYHALVDGLPGVAEFLQTWATETLPAGLQSALELAIAGEPEAAAAAVKSSVMALTGFGLLGLMGFITVPNALLQDAVDTIWGVTAPLNLLSSVITPVTNLAWSPLLSAGIVAQKVVDAANAGDVLGAVGAVLNAPADAVDHFLNSQGGLADFRPIGSGGTLYSGGLLTQLLLKIPNAIKVNLAPPIPVPATAAATVAPLAITATNVSVSPATSSLAAEPPAAPASTPAPSTTASSAESDTTAAVNVSSQDATELSDGTKAGPSGTGAIALRQGQKLKASLKNAAGQAEKGRNGVRSDLEKTIKKVTDRLSKVGKNKQAGVTSSSTDSSKNKDKTGSDD